MAHRRWILILSLALVLVTTAVLAAGCGGSDTGATAPDPAATASTVATTAPDSATTSTPTAGQEFTLAELAEFDGKDGQPAYVAVDGVVYDVSDSARWGEGTHTECNLGASAGRDLSDVIQQAPANMRSLLSRMPIAGSLVQ